MAAIQTLLDNATRITIDNRRPTASTISRGQHLKTQSRANSVYKFIVGMHPALKYEDYRGLLSEYDATGRTTEEEVSLSNVSCSAYLMEYQGGLTTGDQGNLFMTASTVVGDTNIKLNVSATTDAVSSTVVVEKGDFIQPAGSRYPYQATAQVLHGAGSDITIPINRAIVFEDGYTYTSNGVVFGNNCTFRVKMIEQPTYTIIPGRYIQWDGDMALMEIIT